MVNGDVKGVTRHSTLCHGVHYLRHIILDECDNLLKIVALICTGYSVPQQNVPFIEDN